MLREVNTANSDNSLVRTLRQTDWLAGGRQAVFKFRACLYLGAHIIYCISVRMPLPKRTTHGFMNPSLRQFDYFGGTFAENGCVYTSPYTYASLKDVCLVFSRSAPLQQKKSQKTHRNREKDLLMLKQSV